MIHPDVEHARSCGEHHVIGNVQWRFTPSATVRDVAAGLFAEADYRNQVIDGRTREEGSDRDLTWRGGATGIRGRPPHRVRRAGAVARCRAHRSRASPTPTENVFLDDRGDAWSAAGWAQYRWTPSARVVDHARRPRSSTGSCSINRSLAVAADGIRGPVRARACVSAAASSTSRRRIDHTRSFRCRAAAGPERARHHRRRPRAALWIGLAPRRGTIYHRRDEDRFRFGGCRDSDRERPGGAAVLSVF